MKTAWILAEPRADFYPSTFSAIADCAGKEDLVFISLEKPKRRDGYPARKMFLPSKDLWIDKSRRAHK